MKINDNKLCFGTGTTYIHDTGIRRKRREVCFKLKGLNGNYYKSIHLPNMIDLCMQNGCSMFDTSRAYNASEFTLGHTLKKYKRDEYYIITKLCNKDQFGGNVRGGLEKSLDELGLDYVDLYLMHWPVKDHFIDSWKEMEMLYKEGKCRAIGVCNFNIHHIEELRKHAEILPAVNEIECHPLFTQDELRRYCKANGIQVLAYTSTARNDERLGKTCLKPIAEKYNKTMTQVILKWHQQIGNIPIVNSSNKEHMIENINIDDFMLTNQEIDMITSININSRLRYDPDNCDFSQL